MKTKKFWMMLAIALVSLCTISCGGDDDDDKGTSSNPIVGTWWVEGDPSDWKQAVYTEITYNSDMTCSWREYQNSRDQLTSSDTGKYQIDGNTLSIWWNSVKDSWDEEGPWTTTFTINGNKMITTESSGTTWTKK